MTDSEIKKWFIDKWYSCYFVVHDNLPNRVFLFYDESISRKMKLCKLNKIECEIDKVKGKCLFQQNYNHNNLYCDYDEIWSFLYKNYTTDCNGIQEFIKSILEEQNKLNVLKPKAYFGPVQYLLKEQHNLKALTPVGQNLQNIKPLEEQDKLKVV